MKGPMTPGRADGMTGVSGSDFERTAGLDDWRVLGDGACIHFRTTSFADAARSSTRPRLTVGLDGSASIGVGGSHAQPRLRRSRRRHR